MKLDPRIKSLSDILTPFDTERAKELIGQKGFFANGIEFFRDGEPHCVYGTLTRVFDHQDQTDPYLKMEGGDLYSFFLPESSLKPEEKKPEEKKYRPYTPEEFCDKFQIGRPIEFKAKETDGVRLRLALILPTDNQALKRGFELYQKLTGVLEALEGDGRKDEVL